MTYHYSLNTLSNSCEYSRTSNPLADPSVLQVLPFLLAGNDEPECEARDIASIASCFDDDETMQMIDPFIYLKASSISAMFGESIADILEGCTGLVVLVDQGGEMDVRPGEVLGRHVDVKGTYYCIVEAPAGWMIFIQKSTTASLALAA